MPPRSDSCELDNYKLVELCADLTEFAQHELIGDSLVVLIQDEWGGPAQTLHF